MRRTEVLAYTAGIVDGEGHITISDKPDARSYKLQVAVTNTNEWLCQWLKMQYGGRVWSWAPLKINWKRAYRWELTYGKASEFLELIIPFLNLKKPQAEIAIRYQNRRRIGGHYTNEESVLNEADRILMSTLNKRGL